MHNVTIRTAVLAGIALALAAPAAAQEAEMGKSCDWLKRAGIKTVAPGAAAEIKVLIHSNGTVYWNGEALENRRVLMEKVDAQKKAARVFPATLIEAHEQSPRFYVQPVFRIFSDAKVVPACAAAAPVAAAAPAPAEAPAAVSAQ